MREEVDLTAVTSPRAGPPPSKRQRLDFVDLTSEECSGPAVAGACGPVGLAGPTSSRAVGGAAAPPASASVQLRRPSRGRAHPAPLAVRRQQQQQQQQPQPLRHSPQDGSDSDWMVAKRLQDEEDQRAATAEASLQRRFRELEAAEAAAEAEEAAAAAQNRGWGRTFLGGWFGGGGSGHRGPRSGGGGGSSSAAAAAAAAAAGAAGGSQGHGPPRAQGRGPRSQRSRRGPAAEAEYANDFAAFLPPPHRYGGAYGGGRGAFFGELQALMAGLQRGLPADLLFSGRDFGEADYEQLLALDRGNKKKTAPRDRVAALDTVRVPPAGASCAAAAAAAVPGGQGGSGRGGGAGAGACASPGGSEGSGSPGARDLDACVICLEDARPGDRFRVLPCRHAFHCACIDRWLTQERNSCPICQREAV